MFTGRRRSINKRKQNNIIKNKAIIKIKEIKRKKSR